MKILQLLGLVIVFISTYSSKLWAIDTALGLPLPLDAAPAYNFDDGTEPEQATTQADFRGIVALDNCSGSIVRFEDNLPHDKAYVLTNGHCYEGGFLQHNETLINQPSNRRFKVLAKDPRSTLGTVNATKIAYATMKDTDIAIYELNETFADIESKFKVSPLSIKRTVAEKGTPIQILSGYWRREYNCHIDDFVHELHEADWVWKNSIRYTSTGCKTIGGTSGSPIIDAENRVVVGVNNTGNEDGERCTMNNPCEVDSKGEIIVKHGASYGQQINMLYTCRTSSRGFDFEKEECLLP